MEQDETTSSSFSPLRRFGIGLNVALSVLAMGALVLMCNYLAARHFSRYQWTGDTRNQLSPETRRVLSGVTNSVKVTVLFDRQDPLFALVSGLLTEYMYACPKVLVEFVDYKRDPPRAIMVTKQYHLSEKSDANQVIFDAAGRVKVVRAAELSDYDMGALISGQKEVQRIAFKGERHFTGAIASLLEPRQPTAYFLQGHGEHDPNGEVEAYGYAEFSRLLGEKNIKTSTLALAGNGSIPDDCQLLIVAGPQNPLLEAERDKISRYLAQGGRLLALASRHRSQRRSTGLEQLLASWGVRLGEDYTFDVSEGAYVVQGGMVCTNYSSHPIVRPLERKMVYLVWPRSVWPSSARGAGSDGVKALPLISTTAGGRTASEVGATGAPVEDPQRDVHGVIPLAVAVEKGSIQGASADRGSTRVVVVGDSYLFGNGTIDQVGNADFASGSVDWLLARPEYLAAIAPQPIRQYRVTLTQAEVNRLSWILLAGFPGLVLLLGLLVWARRRA